MTSGEINAIDLIKALRESAEAVACKLLAQIKEREERIAALEWALSFYADFENWEGGPGDTESAIRDDWGDTACTALGLPLNSKQAAS